LCSQLCTHAWNNDYNAAKVLLRDPDANFFVNQYNARGMLVLCFFSLLLFFLQYSLSCCFFASSYLFLVFLFPLLRHCNRFCLKFSGQTPLFCAARQNAVPVLVEMLKMPAVEKEIDKTMLGHGGTALHAATFQGHGLVTYLMLRFGASYVITNSNGLTAR
jgi:ankyrin repeat protein